MIRMLQFGDVHLDASTVDNVHHAMGQILKLAREERPQLIVNTGDLSMRRGHLAPWVGAMLREWHCYLAEIAPVVVVAGNHDLSYADAVGTVCGALSFSAAKGITLVERPHVIDALMYGFPVACLPYPSRYMLQAVEPGLSPQEVNVRAGELVERILRGLGAEAGDGSLLVMHGSIAGARTSSEIQMTTDMDVVIPEPMIPEAFTCVMAGHIHRHQQIGRAVYSGSPCPLNFGEDHEHGVVLWEDGAPRFIELEPKHRLVTLDFRESAPRWDNVEGARVRVLLRMARGGSAQDVVEEYRRDLTNSGATEVRFLVEHATEDRAVELGDVRSDLGHGELLALYAKRTPDAEPLLEDLARVFADVDGQLSPEARALERYAEYRLHRIAWSNWKSLEPGEIVFEDLGSLVCVEGENATGKSNLVEVESFALWGKLPRGRQALADLVRIGEQEAWVEAEFVTADIVWRVRRTVRLNSKGLGVGDLVLQEYVDAPGAPTCDWCPANAGTAAETQRKIEHMVGPHELYLATRFASQGDIDRLLEMTPSELKDALQSALGTKAFEAREEIAKRMLSEANNRLAMADRKIESLREQLAQADDVEATLAKVREEHAAAVTAHADAEKALAAAREALEHTKAAAAEQEQRRKARAEREVEQQRLRARAETIGEEIAQLAGAAVRAEDARTRLGQLEELRAQLPALEAAEAEHRKALAAVTEARVAAEATRGEHDLAVKARVHLKQRIDHHEGQRQRAEQDASLIGRVPFKEKCAEAGCGFVSLAIKGRDSLPGLKEQGVKLAAEWAESGACIDRLMRAMNACAGELSDRAKALDAKRPAVKKLDDLRKEIGAVPERELRLAEAAAQQAEGRAGALRQEQSDVVARLTAVLEELGKMPPATDLSRDVREAEVDVRAKEELLAGWVRTDRTLADEVAKLTGKLEIYASVRQSLEPAEMESHARAREVKVLGVFVRAMSRDGLPYLVLERAIPALEQHANHFLGQGDLSLEIEPMRDLRSGEQKSEVHVRYRDRFGLHPLPAASGYQRVALGYALRAALAQFQAETHGLKVSHWIGDEGWGSFDESRILEGQQMLRRLSERFERVLYITHTAPIREVADTRIRVSANGAGSVVELVA